ncbi:NACHT domain-containing protein [Streptomyces sp. MAR4 CNX-425]|uniref:NACHT domain-containing protein n=1 Tax=Streptomyces sp. MAR4 CNX-425 TaxID=3406343 RepID=UPI003B5010A1
MRTDGGGGDREGALAELARRLRRLRVERRLSMPGLERRAGLGHTTVSRALNGSGVPSEATVVELARALGADAGELLELRGRALPPVPRPAPADRAAPVAPADAGTARFEERYRRYVSERHGMLSVIGLDLSRPERARWPLDAAYLSLELATPTFRAVPDGDGGAAARGHRTEVTVERAEQALAGLRRVLVRGLAGCGKTALLQWLAVSTARGTLPARLDQLSGGVPFVLPLRTLVRRGDLPAPEEYLAAVRCPLAAAQSPGWADGLLADGRAVLLIDGVDEVPLAQRHRARQWLYELIAAYPRATYVVTTRPSAVPEGWLADSDFTDLTIRPMNNRDVAVFVDRWHRAVAATAAGEAERADVEGLGESLKDTVRAQRDLARLVSTPLLCALVCALHRDRRGHLPHGRMELYQAALSMLLHRRDDERDITAPEDVVLSEGQSIQLLQRLAYWLIRNGQTELDRDVAAGLVADALPAMPAVAEQADAAQVLDHLLARSGLLRSPAADTVDFVHRTFQDYLGAKAAVEARDIPLLVRHAHDDQWEDVLRMATAHARPDERATFLTRLVTRGDRSPEHRTRLHLLATACLEHATELDPRVREEVQSRTRALLPPRHRDEAAVLAAAGPVVLDLLPGPEGLEEDEAEAVVLTAGRIGGDAALTVLKRFRRSPARVVGWQLQHVWDRYDTDDYVRDILAHIPDLRFIDVGSADQLAALRTLDTPRAVNVRGDFPADALTGVLDPARLRRLSLVENLTLRDLAFLGPYRELKRVSLVRCPRLTDITALAGSQVTALDLWECPAEVIAGLAHLHGIRQLMLDGALPYRDVGALPVAADLVDIRLGPTAHHHLRLDGIGRWPHLTRLNLCGPIDGFAHAGGLSRLQYLVLQLDARLSMLALLPPSPQVRILRLYSWRPGDDLDLVRTRLPGLTALSISCHADHRHIDLTPLRGMTGLTSISLDKATSVTGAEHFPEGTVTRTPRPRTP